MYIDADSCPRPVRDLVGRACLRCQVPLVFVANREIPFEEGHPVEMVLVENQEGAADRWLVDQVTPADLVITRDIPLAAALVEKGLLVLNDRGDVYTSENIRPRLSLRNFMADLRQSGIQAETTSSYGKKEKEAFARAFDKHFNRLLKLAQSKS